MDGLQFLPPTLVEKLMERKVVLASILAWKMAATGLLPKVVQVGCWGVGVFGSGLIDESPILSVDRWFLQKSRREVYKNPCKSMRFQLPTSTSTGEFARTGFLVAIHRPGWTWRFLMNDSIKIRPTNFKRWKLLTLKGFQI